MRTLITLFCLLLTPAQAAYHYVRSGASGGTKTGNDWANAYLDIPTNLIRGDTYYVATGTYTNFTIKKDEEGVKVITIKKAAPLDHGPAADWNAAYGVGQAVFATSNRISRGYIVFDGSYRNEADWFDGNAYGFKIVSNSVSWDEYLVIHNGSTACNNITVKYLFIAGREDLPGVSGERLHGIDCENFSSGPVRYNTNYLFQRMYIRGTSNPYFVRCTYSPIVEYCANSHGVGNDNYHFEAVNLFWHSAAGANPVVRYCYFKHNVMGPTTGGTGIIAIADAVGAEIYGNIFDEWQEGNGVIAAGWDNYNLKVYNNTFLCVTNKPLVHFPGVNGSGNMASNNVSVNCLSAGMDGIGTFGNNSTLYPSNFVNFATRDLRLIGPTTAGTTLPSKFSIDPLGVTRGYDGVWDRGAYEYWIPGPTIDDICFYARFWIPHTPPFTWDPAKRAVAWFTPQLANSIVDVAGDKSYTNASLSTGHVINFLIQNPPQATTWFTVRSVDAAGNMTTKGPFAGNWDPGWQRVCCNPVGMAETLIVK